VPIRHESRADSWGDRPRKHPKTDGQSGSGKGEADNFVLGSDWFVLGCSAADNAHDPEAWEDGNEDTRGKS